MQTRKAERDIEEVVAGMVTIFDLLAQFDYEDKKRESVLALDTTSPAPVGGVVPVAEQVAESDGLPSEQRIQDRSFISG